jgi:hypothetical protein
LSLLIIGKGSVKSPSEPGMGLARLMQVRRRRASGAQQTGPNSAALEPYEVTKRMGNLLIIVADVRVSAYA